MRLGLGWLQYGGASAVRRRCEGGREGARHGTCEVALEVAEAARTSVPAACNPKRQFLLEVQLPEMLPEQREQARGHMENRQGRVRAECAKELGADWKHTWSPRN